MATGAGRTQLHDASQHPRDSQCVVMCGACHDLAVAKPCCSAAPEPPPEPQPEPPALSRTTWCRSALRRSLELQLQPVQCQWPAGPCQVGVIACAPNLHCTSQLGADTSLQSVQQPAAPEAPTLADLMDRLVPELRTMVIRGLTPAAACTFPLAQLRYKQSSRRTQTCRASQSTERWLPAPSSCTSAHKQQGASAV